jgi:Phosphatidylinositol 3- and 4-kinase.
MNHPQSAHALDVLAASSRDAAGNPLTAQHDALLKHPNCNQGHVESIRRAIAEDNYLPIQHQLARLKDLEGLSKKEGQQIRLGHTSDPLEKIVKVSGEESKHPELLSLYNKAVNSTNPIAPTDSDLHQVGMGSPKVLYRLPYEGGFHKAIVKPYMEEENPISGWSESTSQELYQAAEIPHLHQKSFVGSYNNGDQHIPATVIHIEDSKPIHKVPQKEILEKNPKASEDARKIAVMDFLTSNPDRHSNNLMVRPNGQLMAIDHGLSFSYAGAGGLPGADANSPDFSESYIPSKKSGSHLGRYSRKAPSLLNGGLEPNDLDYHHTIKAWWPLVSPDIKRTFQKRLELIQNPAIRRHLEAGFNARHQWLDNAAKIEPEQFQEELKKSIDAEPPKKIGLHTYAVIQPKPPESKKYDTVHQELLNAHPKHLQPNVDKFEKYINHPTNPVAPEKGELSGIEQKALVKHATNHYLLKAASTPWNPLSGWGEMTSQAMYHAGGIGNLHQHVHATNLNIKEGSNTRQQPAIAIHFRPGKWRTLSEVERSGKPGEARDFVNNNGKDLAKSYVMDFLTGNGDRHDENILVGPKGEPQMIDQAFAFRRDNWSNPEDQRFPEVDHRGVGDVPDGGAFNFPIFANDHGLGMMATKDTHDWWLQHKKPIVEAFNKHIDMIPDKKERARRKAMFEYRVNAVDNKHPLLFNYMEKSEDLSKGAMQRLHSFNPQSPGTSETYAEPLNNWVSDEQPKAREQLGLMGMEPSAKARALHKLHAKTEVRRNPHTNEREFLLHRGFGATQLQNLKAGKFDSTAPRTDKKKANRTIPYTSWSVDPNETHTSDFMVSAWVPESKIASYLPQYNKLPGLNETSNQLMQDEKEVIAEPGQYDIFHQDRGRDWLMGLTQKIQSLHKSLGNASFLHDQHTAFPTQQGMQANMKGVHEKLMKSVPSSLGPNIRHFEIAVNQSKNPVKPIAEQKDLQGLQPKALYEHNGSKFLVKAAVENSTAMGAWNEMTSQALYHAGNIGHLHQKVHATIGQTGLNRSEPAHAIAIHMEPNSMALGDASGWEDVKGNKYPAKDLERFNNVFKNPRHMESLRRIGMMDFLTGNSDRHLMNIVLKPDGSPTAIDHGRSFHVHRKHALGRESSEDLHGLDLQGNPYDHEPGFLADPNYKDQFIPDYKTHMKDSLAAEYGGTPTAETWNWWNDNKDAIANKFREHLNMLPDAEVRKKMHDVFMLRHNRLSNEFQKGSLQADANSVPLDNDKPTVALPKGNK